MTFLAGLLTGWFLIGMYLFARRAWRKAYEPPPVVPRSPAQQHNRAATEAYIADHPTVGSITFTRNRRRGNRRVRPEQSEF